MATLMSFGGFLETKQSDGGGGRIVVSDIPYNSNNGSNHSNDIMPSGAISLPRLATPTLAKSMFNSPGLSLALVRFIHSISYPFVSYKGFLFWLVLFAYFFFFLVLGKTQQSDIDGQGDMNRLMPENFEQNGLRRSQGS